MLSNQEYEALAARHNGFTSGVAKSKELNKVWRQASLIASAVAQFIVDTDQKDLLDTGDFSDIKARLSSAINLIISNGDYVTNPVLKLELLKKIDKADITQQLGNDTSKVASQNLLTTELGKKASVADANSKLAKDQNGADIPDKPKFIENLGLPEKYQPKGDYQPSGDYVKTPPALLDGNKKITEQLFGGLGVGIRAQSPFPSDAPVQSAFKIMQIGDDEWPTFIGFDAYQRRIFITTRKSQGGELLPWDELIRESRLSTLPFFGQGQTYQNYLSSRTPNTAYTNSSGRTIFIVVSAVQDTAGVPVVLTAVVDGNEITTHSYGSSARATISIPIPDKSWYRINVSGGSNARVVTWLEVRE